MSSTIHPALMLLRAASTSNPYATLVNRFTAGAQSYSFPTDSRGRSVLPTMATLEKTTDPAAKLAVAGQLADVVKIQADAATRTGLPNRVGDMTARAQEVLTAVEAIVDGLKSPDGTVAPGDADPALEPHRKALSRVLGTLHATLTEVSALLEKAKPDVAATTDKAIQRFDITAGGLAARAGLNWEPLPSVTSGATSANPSKLLDILV